MNELEKLNEEATKLRARLADVDNQINVLQQQKAKKRAVWVKSPCANCGKPAVACYHKWNNTTANYDDYPACGDCKMTYNGHFIVVPKCN